MSQEKQTNCLLSVITPCYNSAKSLIAYFEKLEKQDLAYLKLIEFIIIDDCSTDNSFLLLKKYCEESKINFFVKGNNKNLGPGQCRNIGIQLAKGQYITFLDSDDEFSDNFFEIVIPLIKTEEFDCIIFNYKKINKNKRIKESIFLKKTSGLKKEEIVRNIKGCPWCKIYKKRIITDYNVAFDCSFIGEDMPFTKAAISYCDRFYLIDNELYNYYQNNDSLTHKSNKRSVENYIHSFLLLEKNINKNFQNTLASIYMYEVLYEVGLAKSLELNRDDWNKLFNELISLKKKNTLFNSIKYVDIKRKIVLYAILNRCYYLTQFLVRLIRR